MEIKTSILPSSHQFAKIDKPNELHHEAICVFVALGFFLGEDTYWKNKICLKTAHNYQLDNAGQIISKTPNFNWHYTPRTLSFNDALDEYIALLTTIMGEQAQNKPVILPLSGGLDSRSQALVLSQLPNPVTAFSYAFKGGYPEHKISAQIAKVCGFKFSSFQIEKGYLWDVIDDLATINQCYSEFTHPRQMAVLSQLKKMTGEFSLGHWGDVLFDKGCANQLQKEDVIPYLFKIMVKPAGLELAEMLWKHWGLKHDFKSYLTNRLETALSKIKIDNLSAKLRAFKTTHWAHRWTTTNLTVFSAAHKIHLPYYDDRMLQFICTVPEDYLADRKLQIAHLQTHKALAKITWHAQKPFNLLNYHNNKSPYNIPYRLRSKLQREFNSLLGKPYIQRNWELQFLGSDNDAKLQSYIHSKAFNTFVPKTIIDVFYNKFKNDNAVKYSHALSMLLTLSSWYKQEHVNL